MSYAGYGALAAIGMIVVVGTTSAINRSANYEPAEATVFRIDRTCTFNQTLDDKTVGQSKEDCSSTSEFREIADSSKRKFDVDGNAVVKVSYTAPQDGSYQTSELRYTGRDEQFYDLKAGDKIAVLVSNEDVSKIIAD